MIVDHVAIENMIIEILDESHGGIEGDVYTEIHSTLDHESELFAHVWDKVETEGGRFFLSEASVDQLQ